MTQRALTAKQRAALCRRRKARGLVSLSVDVPLVPLTELLISTKYLRSQDQDDRSALRDAAEKWIADETAPARYETVTALRRALLNAAKHGS